MRRSESNWSFMDDSNDGIVLNSQSSQPPPLQALPVNGTGKLVKVVSSLQGCCCHEDALILLKLLQTLRHNKLKKWQTLLSSGTMS